MDDARGPTRREALRITAVAGLSLAVGGGLTREILRRAGLHRVGEARPAMGTLVSLTFVHPDPAAARHGVRAGFAEMERLESILSRHAPGTALSSLNATGRLEPAPADLRAVLAAAGRHHHRTGGAFDPTVAPLLELWTTRHGAGAEPPGEAEVARVLRDRVGFEGVEVEGDVIRLARPGMALTLDGIAKGYIVDRAVAALAREGGERILVDAGGDMASGGRAAAGEPWAIEVQDPHRPGRSLGRVGLAGDAVATSGDYARAFTRDRRHHPVLDPRTGRSPEGTSSATVMAPTAMDADALSTALMVTGPEEGLRLLARTPGAEGVLVDKDGTVHTSPGMTRVGA